MPLSAFSFGGATGLSGSVSGFSGENEPASGGDATPGGAADVWLMESSGGWLLEDGASYWLIES